VSSLTISGGTVITRAGGVRADLEVTDGRIRSLSEPGMAATGARQIDASGCLVLPGGVDPHTHVMGDIVAATRAAALGGTTTVLSFTNPASGESGLDCLLRRERELAATGPVVDVGLHAMLYEPDRVRIEELQAIRDRGACAVKVFLAYAELGIMWSERGLFELMTAAARTGQIVQVHCEEGELIDGLLDKALVSGSKGPRVFADTRPPQAESAAVARTLATAAVTGACCYLTHLSCASSISQVRLARHAKTARLWAEVCLHHLLLDSTRYESTDAERYLVAPPLRSLEDCEQLWEALSDGTIDTLGSDHSQTRSETIADISLSGRGYYYGLAGIGARVPLALSRGLARGLPIERLVHLVSTGPALAFGIHPKKGSIAPGSDADIVIWDPVPTTTLGTYSFDDGTGDSVYDGEPLVGQVRDVLVRGEQVVRDGHYLGAEPAGRYVRASRSDPSRL
jgi:dihydropyrimidinase